MINSRSISIVTLILGSFIGLLSRSYASEHVDFKYNPERGTLFSGLLTETWNTNTPREKSQLVKRLAPNEEKKLICYYHNEAAERPGKGRITADNLDPFLCTHLIYSFLTLSETGGVKSKHPKIDFSENNGLGMMKKLVSLKEVNPKLKVLLSVEEGRFGVMAATKEGRAKFVRSVMSIIENNNFDGLDMAWKYPNECRGKPEDKASFVALLHDFKEALSPKGYLLSVPGAITRNSVNAGYDIPQIAKYVDFINLQTFDYNGNWDNETGLHAPLYYSSKYDLRKEEEVWNANWSVSYWLEEGAPAEKLMLSIPTFGRTFTLTNNNQYDINSPASGPSKPGPYTNDKRLMGYHEICAAIKDQGWIVEQVPEHEVPYAHKDNTWVAFDNRESAVVKVEYVDLMNLGGVVVTGLDTDDFSGYCHEQKYPITNAIRNELLEPKSHQSPTQNRNLDSSNNSPTETSSRQVPTKSPEVEDETPAPPICGTDGQWWFPGPTCNKYYDCTRGTPIIKTCSKGTVWKQEKLWCDYPRNKPQVTCNSLK